MPAGAAGETMRAAIELGGELISACADPRPLVVGWAPGPPPRLPAWLDRRVFGLYLDARLPEGSVLGTGAASVLAGNNRYGGIFTVRLAADGEQLVARVSGSCPVSRLESERREVDFELQLTGALPPPLPPPSSSRPSPRMAAPSEMPAPSRPAPRPAESVGTDPGASRLLGERVGVAVKPSCARARPLLVGVRVYGRMPDWFSRSDFDAAMTGALFPGSRVGPEVLDMVDGVDAAASRSRLSTQYTGIVLVELNPSMERIDVSFSGYCRSPERGEYAIPLKLLSSS
jgi:hypothetical protein